MPKGVRMQFCAWCGEELGTYEQLGQPRDTCGKIECEREMRGMDEAEREEAHDRLDREMGWR